MFKKVLPTYYLEKLFDLDPNDIKKHGINAILCDLDNTINPYYSKVPDENAINFVKKMQSNGIKFYILSNNHEDRVSLFCSKLENVKYSFSTKKPGIKRLNAFLEKEGLDKDKCLIVGDQLLTDCLMANRINIKSLLVEPACSGDLLITKPNRFFDKRIRAYFRRKNMLKSIKED